MTSEISPALFPFFSCCFIKVQFSYTYRSAAAAILLRNFKAVSLLLVLNVCRIVPHMYWKLCNSFHTSLYCKNQLRYINKLCGQIAGFLVSNQLVHILTTGFLRFVNGIPHVLTHFRVACKDKGWPYINHKVSQVCGWHTPCPDTFRVACKDKRLALY